MKTLILRNKNALLELLEGGVEFEKIVLVKDLVQDELTKKIVALARNRQIAVEHMFAKEMEKRRGGQSREVIYGLVQIRDDWSLRELFMELEKQKQKPFFLFINRVKFPSNIGIIARTAFAAGVNGLFYQGEEEAFINDETLHFSVGSLARIPLVKIGIFEALRELNDRGIPTYSLDMNGKSIYKQDLTGPVAFILGAENEGVSETILNKCGESLLIPMQKGVDSLNVGVSAAIVLYEKIRQEG